MIVWVLESECENGYHKIIDIYARKDLAVAKRIECIAEEEKKTDTKEFIIFNIEEFIVEE